MKLAVYGTLLMACVATFEIFASKAETSSKKPTPTGPRQSVLLELFTSEGCSSCPPADRLLETLDRTQPVGSAEAIVLSEHVDYWNRLGWADPFSSAQFSQRQQDYVNHFHLEGAYTPQLVVDGQIDVLGSDAAAAKAAVAKAAIATKGVIDLNARRSGASVKVDLRVTRGGSGSDVNVVLADDYAESQVTRGENSGHTLHHVAVARSLLLAGKTDAQGVLTRELAIPLKEGDNGPLRVVVFLQDSSTKHVLGVTQERL